MGYKCNYLQPTTICVTICHYDEEKEKKKRNSTNGVCKHRSSFVDQLAVLERLFQQLGCALEPFAVVESDYYSFKIFPSF